MARLSAILLLASAILCSGCRDSAKAECVRVCKETGACRRAAKQDCAVVCADYASLDQAAGCAPQFAALLSCQSDLPNVCKSGPCEPALNAWRACLDPYCQKNPATPGCK